MAFAEIDDAFTSIDLEYGSLLFIEGDAGVTKTGYEMEGMLCVIPAPPFDVSDLKDEMLCSWELVTRAGVLWYSVHQLAFFDGPTISLE